MPRKWPCVTRGTSLDARPSRRAKNAPRTRVSGSRFNKCRRHVVQRPQGTASIRRRQVQLRNERVARRRQRWCRAAFDRGSNPTLHGPCTNQRSHALPEHHASSGRRNRKKARQEMRFDPDICQHCASFSDSYHHFPIEELDGWCGHQSRFAYCGTLSGGLLYANTSRRRRNRGGERSAR